MAFFTAKANAGAIHNNKPTSNHSPPAPPWNQINAATNTVKIGTSKCHNGQIKLGMSLIGQPDLNQAFKPLLPRQYSLRKKIPSVFGSP